MKIKLKELNRLQRTFSTILNKEIPVKLAYRMRKITGKLIAEYEQLEKENNALIKKYGTPVKDDKNGRIQVPPEKMDVYRKEYETLLEVEVDLDGEKIPFECLEAMDKISPADLAFIEDFVEAPEK